MPQTPTRHPADTWPPTQLHLSPSLQHSPLDMPLSYFFSAPDHHADADAESPLFDFTAGIEDTKPNFLGTLSSSSLLRRRYEARDVHALSDPSSESDDEDYVRFPAGVEVRRCPDETRRSGVNAKGKRKKGSSRDVSASPNYRSRGRALRRDDEGRRGGNSQGMQRPRAWREPSPYVWSINEEEEDGSSGILKKKGKDVGNKGERRAVSLPKEEPLDEKVVEERLRKRKVRFVLPVKE